MSGPSHAGGAASDAATGPAWGAYAVWLRVHIGCTGRLPLVRR